MLGCRYARSFPQILIGLVPLNGHRGIQYIEEGGPHVSMARIAADGPNAGIFVTACCPGRSAHQLGRRTSTG